MTQRCYVLAPLEYDVEVRRGFVTLRENVVETAESKYLVEVKAANEMDTDEVQTKARAGAVWCAHASDHAAVHGTLPWIYLLIPHDAIADNRTLASLAETYAVTIPRAHAPA